MLKAENLTLNVDDEGGKKCLLNNISFQVEDGEMLVITGPNGGGKSTLAKTLIGIQTPDSGKIILDGQDITALAANERKLNTVFQKYSLFPHMSIAENIAFGLKISKKSKAYIQDKIKYALKLVNLEGFENRSVDSLSGGQQQRVAIGRALITKPKLILADEPTGNLDSKNSQDVIALLTQASRRYQQTILMITHNKDLTASVDRVFRVSDGVLTDLGGKTNEALS